MASSVETQSATLVLHMMKTHLLNSDRATSDDADAVGVIECLLDICDAENRLANRLFLLGDGLMKALRS